MQTRSPSLRVLTSGPASMTVPEASWPRIIGSLDDEGADGAVGVVVHVGAADADGVQLDAHVAGAERLLALDGEVAEGELVLLFEDEGLHGEVS